MVVVFDIGNSNIRIGLYKNRKLMRRIVSPTRRKIPRGKIKVLFSHKELDGVVVVSVVPKLTKQVIEICRMYNIKPMIISSKLKSGIKYSYRNPSTLGADRIATAVGAMSLFGRNVIVVDAGSAITIDVITSPGHHLGGVICPGMHMVSEIMYQRTAQLPKLRVTRRVKLIGKSTEECMRSGIFNGTVMMIQGLVRAIKEQTKMDFYCVATGGAGRFLARYIDEIDEYNEDLCLDGALEIYYRHA